MVKILQGDCLEVIKTLPDESVNCCVTSPPYWGLRDYGVEGQLGLERTPEEYVAKMVEVFSEVRRVLRGDGTLWLNLGDSYSGSGKGGNPEGSKWSGFFGSKEREKSAQPKKREADGNNIYHNCSSRNNCTNSNRTSNGWAGVVKPKDLVGIPWMVAKALRDPYYTGTIKRVEDRIWLAAMIDGEGCMFIHKRKAGSPAYSKFRKKDGTEVEYNRTADTYGAGLEVANCHEEIVKRCLEITGMGSICSQGPEQNARRKQQIFRWNLRTNACRDIIREVYPYLVGKKHEARLLIGCPSSGGQAHAAHEALKILHNGGFTDVDFPEPKSMYEEGFYLRQDIIWAKKNCMPESVTDRCTKAHEYIFLMSKSQRYFYDAAAIAEPLESAPHAPGNKKLDVSRNDHDQMSKVWGANGTRNRRSVWTVATVPFTGAHFATFPPKLIEPCILAGCPVGGTVLDPFGGSGTVGMVAENNGRNSILIELNQKYVDMAKRRTAQHGIFC